MEHHTRNTTAVKQWCNICKRQTMHRVDDRRASHCLEDHDKQKSATESAKCPYPLLCQYRKQQTAWKPNCDGKTLCEWAKWLKNNHIQDIRPERND